MLDLFKEVGLAKLLVLIFSLPCMSVSPFYLLPCCVVGSSVGFFFFYGSSSLCAHELPAVTSCCLSPLELTHEK